MSTYMGQTIAECDCAKAEACTLAQSCLAQPKSFKTLEELGVSKGECLVSATEPSRLRFKSWGNCDDLASDDLHVHV